MALRVTPIRFSPFDKFIAGILKMKLEGCLLETVFSSAGAINILRLAEEEGVLGRVERCFDKGCHGRGRGGCFTEVKE